jgi:hypothetical protein
MNSRRPITGRTFEPGGIAERRSERISRTSLPAVKGRGTLCLAIAGTVAVLLAMATTAALLVQRVNCDNGGSPVSICLRYTNSLHWVYPIAAVGVTCFIASSLSTTTRRRRHRNRVPLTSPVKRGTASD